MFDRRQTRNAALLLIPALLAFGLQWSLEVFHPIEEGLPAGHTHGDGRPVVFDPAACGFDSHGPHFCAHSGVHAGLVHAGVVLPVEGLRPGRVTLPEAPITRSVTDVLKRGPPPFA